jgi:hypothetical protein
MEHASNPNGPELSFDLKKSLIMVVNKNAVSTGKPKIPIERVRLERPLAFDAPLAGP